MSDSKKILYTFLGLFILALVVSIVIFMVKTFKSANGLAAAALKDGAENSALSTATGLPTSRIDAIRTLTNNIANEIGTGPEASLLSSYWNSDEQKIINWCNGVTSAEEARTMKNLYENSIVSGSSFYADLDSVLTSSELSRITYISEFH